MYSTKTHQYFLTAPLYTQTGTRSSLPSPRHPRAPACTASSRTSRVLRSPRRTPVHRSSPSKRNPIPLRGRSPSQHRLGSAQANHTSVPHVVKSSSILRISRSMLETSTRAPRPSFSAGIAKKRRKTKVSSSYTVGVLILGISYLCTCYHPSKKLLTAVRFVKPRRRALTTT